MEPELVAVQFDTFQSSLSSLIWSRYSVPRIILLSVTTRPHRRFLDIGAAAFFPPTAGSGSSGHHPLNPS